ncbi:MAG TPA: MipA/OmpV family protein [Stellaceae bacterium]|nr:MipA/OmpV family protein [Stellaceae bacterium]
MAQTPSPLGEWQFSAGVPLRTMFENPMPKWDISFGPAFDYQPDFEGSNSYKAQPGLALDVRYRDIAFISTGEGVGVNLLRGKTYRAGVAITYDLGRSGDDNHHLRSLDNIATAPEVKVFADYVFLPTVAGHQWPIVTRIDARRGFGGNNGYIGDLSLYAPVTGSKTFFVFVGPTVSAADSTYMRNYFGVTSLQATNGHLKPFRPGSGIKDVGIGASATWFFAKHWFMTGDISFEKLVGQAAESPLSVDSTAIAVSSSVEYQF